MVIQESTPTSITIHYKNGNIETYEYIEALSNFNDTTLELSANGKTVYIHKNEIDFTEE